MNELPWKGGSEDNPDYECFRSELRKMVPPNGSAVLLFGDKCGCSVAKLEGWGPKRSRRLKNRKLSETGARANHHRYFCYGILFCTELNPALGLMKLQGELFLEFKQACFFSLAGRSEASDYLPYILIVAYRFGVGMRRLGFAS